jgi:hypothetical protein
VNTIITALWACIRVTCWIHIEAKFFQPEGKADFSRMLVPSYQIPSHFIGWKSDSKLWKYIFNNDSWNLSNLGGGEWRGGLAFWDNVSVTRRIEINYVQQHIIQLEWTSRGITHSDQTPVLLLLTTPIRHLYSLCYLLRSDFCVYLFIIAIGVMCLSHQLLVSS